MLNKKKSPIKKNILFRKYYYGNFEFRFFSSFTVNFQYVRFFYFFRNFSNHFFNIASFWKLLIFSYLCNKKKSPIRKNILSRKYYYWNFEIRFFSSFSVNFQYVTFCYFFRNFSNHFLKAESFLKLVIISYLLNKKKSPIMKHILFRKDYYWNFEIMFFSFLYSKLPICKIFFIFFEISVIIFSTHALF